MSINERIARAQVTDNLGEARNDGELADVDIVRACGMVAAKMPLHVAIWRWKFARIEDEAPWVAHVLSHQLLRRGKAQDLEQAQHVVARVVYHWLDDTCPHCEGRGFEVMPGAPVLSDKPCSHCEGTGEVAFVASCEAESWLLDRLEQMEREAAAAINRKLFAD